MNTSNPRMWLVGGIMAAVALLAVGWSFLISPRMEAVAQTREEAVTLDDQARTIAAQAVQLQQQAQELPAQIRALRRIQTRIPANVDIPALLRDIERLAKDNNLTLDALTPGQITVFTVTADTADSTTSSTESTEPQASPDATQAPEPTPTDLGQGKLPEGVGLSYVPVSIVTTGQFADVERFTSQVETLQRAYLITGVQLARSTSATDDQGANPLTLTLSTRVFVTDDRLRNLPDQALQQVRGK